MNQMKVPTHLEHKPIFILENYNDVDGHYDHNKTDAKGMSIGIAQWSSNYHPDFSAKVWRHTGDKWSRQSEEIPFHRLLDLTSLLLSVMVALKTGAPTIPLDIEGTTFNIHLTKEKNKEMLDTFLNNNSDMYDSRLKTIATLLAQLDY